MPVVLLAASLLTIGISRDYRLKHEDNNALHATFARAHLNAGLGVTRGHDAFVSPDGNQVLFYGHHPSGCGLLLAGVFSITGREDPMVVRGVAITATLLALILIWRLVRKTDRPEVALAAAMAFSVLPLAAFYGRMVNHEILVLPITVLLVEEYFALARGGSGRAATGLTLAAVLGSLVSWVTFFTLAACLAHALMSRRRSDEFPAARRAAAVLGVLSLSLFAIDIAHIAWVKGGDLSDLVQTFSTRTGSGQEYGAFEWVQKMLDFSRRLSSTSGTIALLWIAARSVGALAGKVTLKPLEEKASVFLLSGVGYLAVFNWGAWQHHYWQYPLLPAVVIALALAIASLLEQASAGLRSSLRRVIVGLIVVEVLATSTVGLYKRHNRPEDRVIQTVQSLRSQHL